MHEVFASHFMCMCAFAKSIRGLLKVAFRIFISERNALGWLFSYKKYYATNPNFAEWSIILHYLEYHTPRCFFGVIASDGLYLKSGMYEWKEQS